MLVRLGWSVHRIWSAAWAADPDGENARLVDAYAKAVADAHDARVGVEARDERVGVGVAHRASTPATACVAASDRSATELPASSVYPSGVDRATTSPAISPPPPMLTSTSVTSATSGGADARPTSSRCWRQRPARSAC